jgi:hypothetical protein
MLGSHYFVGWKVNHCDFFEIFQFEFFKHYEFRRSKIILWRKRKFKVGYFLSNNVKLWGWGADKYYWFLIMARSVWIVFSYWLPNPRNSLCKFLTLQAQTCDMVWLPGIWWRLVDNRSLHRSLTQCTNVAQKTKET